MTNYYKQLVRQRLYGTLDDDAHTRSDVALSTVERAHSHHLSERQQRIFLLPSHRSTSGMGSGSGSDEEGKPKMLVYAPVALESLSEAEARSLAANEAWVSRRPSLEGYQHQHQRRELGRSCMRTSLLRFLHSHRVYNQRKDRTDLHLHLPLPVRVRVPLLVPVMVIDQNEEVHLDTQLHMIRVEVGEVKMRIRYCYCVRGYNCVHLDFLQLQHQLPRLQRQRRHRHQETQT